MKIRGKFVLSVALTMLFAGLLLFTHVMVFAGRSSVHSAQRIDHLAGVVRDVLMEAPLWARGAAEEQGTPPQAMFLNSLFPGGWAVLEKDRTLMAGPTGAFSALSCGEWDRFLHTPSLKKSVFSAGGGTWLAVRAEGFPDLLFAGALEPSFIVSQVQGHFIKGFFATYLIAVLGVSLIVFIAASKLVIRPMMKIGDALYRISSGDYTRATGIGNTFDEGQKLAEVIDDMMQQFRDYHGDVEKKVRRAYEESVKHQKNLIIAQRHTATGKLAAGIAHEINNPLGGMLNAVGVLKTEAAQSPQKVRDYLLLIEDGLNRIRATVGKILQFQQTGRLDMPAPVLLGDPVEKALSFAAHRIQEKGIRVALPDWAGIPAVSGSEVELQQVFLNLFLNAADAMSEGGTLGVSWKAQDKKLAVEVKDDGCGIGRRELSQIFDLFYTTKPAGEGTGLGLFIVYTVVKNHGGDIEVESEKGRGTVVRLTFPTEKIQNEK
jgi:signal transduction histidine kinase